MSAVFERKWANTARTKAGYQKWERISLERVKNILARNKPDPFEAALALELLLGGDELKFKLYSVRVRPGTAPQYSYKTRED